MGKIGKLKVPGPADYDVETSFRKTQMRGTVNNKLNKLKKQSFLDLEIQRSKRMPGVGAY